jgi:hypothetical protein
MPTRHNNGSHYDSHQRGAELQDVGAHAHRVAEQQGKPDHLTAHEQSRHALEHSPDEHPNAGTPTVGHGISAFGHDDIAALAREFWQARGCPEGSPQEDWFRAVEELRSRNTGR